MENSPTDPRPFKRAKLESDQMDDVQGNTSTMASGVSENDAQTASGKASLVSDDAAKEVQVGITVFVDDSKCTFRGILKKRYTDFLVNEILPDGSVLHLQTTKANNGTASADLAGPSSAIRGGTEQAGTSLKGSGPKAETSDISPPKKEEPEVPTEDSAAQDNSTELSEEDRASLVEHFSEETVSQMSGLYQSILRHPQWKSRDHAVVRTAFTSDRNVRSKIHQEIRRIFRGKIDSSTDNEGILVLTASFTSSRNGNNQGRSKPNHGQPFRPNKLAWQERGGEYLHFTLAKENKDTLEVISYLTKQLKTNTKTFQFAGTKDRRAVTVQRVSAYRVDAERMVGLNRTLRYAAVGDYEYHKQGLELGDLSGNEFVITLRDCHLGGSALEQDTFERREQLQSYLKQSLQQLHDKGFLNFYGLQRFGTYATRTDLVGLKILQGDFKGACDALLEFSPQAINAASFEVGILVSQDDRSRAEGINLFRTTGRINEALDKIPRKFSAETNIIRHLGKHRQDFLGALLGIQRNLRLMYVHAYQSLVWNLAAGERWRLYRDQVVEGDLVLVHEHKEKVSGDLSQPQQSVDAEGEVIIEPSGDDKAYDKEDIFERARALSAEEAASGQYSMFDVVLPLPGYDVLYPANESGVWYKSFMASEAGGNLDPYNMRRKQRDFSLSGSYRKVMARIGKEWEARVEEYDESKGEKQFVETDLEKLQKVDRKDGHERNGQPTTSEGSALETPTEVTNKAHEPEHPVDAPQPVSVNKKLAAVLKFQLSSSQYATMALRELSKGGIQAYKAEFLGGR